ncbi:DUF1338 domain-containing protein [Halomonas halmophila]|uniref:2-oxoadipate dioxygenase/decarboxylase n=1 Tax=Halomonas halmophila TaxID=252 RepID=A0A4Y4EZ19_9GAMM|nr:DUF1338 domain-containing protein [Halomonas halmophila]GED22427.1 hypothetical protein HHA01_14040 [Halomonas halmophila]
MQRDTLVQALWLDHANRQPDIAELKIWPETIRAEYLTLLTLSQGPWSAKAMMPRLAEHGYRPRYRYAMPERGLLLTLLATDMPHDTWLVLAEFQVATLARRPRDLMQRLVDRAAPGHGSLPIGGRPWPMPAWDEYRLLEQADPLAGWLAIMGTRVHHTGFDCHQLEGSLEAFDRELARLGYVGNADRRHGVFPVSPLLDYRFYQGRPQRLFFAGGDRHDVPLGGLALIQQRVNTNQERGVELLLPQHALCELG